MQTPPTPHDVAIEVSSDKQPAPPEPKQGPAMRLFRRFWNPRPVPKPRIEPELVQMQWPERTAEVLRHSVLSLEYWLSQGGWLREWVRLNLWVGVVLLVAALLAVPPVTAILEGVRDWTGLISATVGNINAAVTSLPSIVLALATGFLLVKLIRHWRAKRREQERHPYGHYE